MDVNEDKERNEKIKQLFHVGWSVNKIAAKYGISMYCVCHILGPQTFSVMSAKPISKSTDDVMYLSGINDAYQEKYTNDMAY